uniref:AIG1-type G domain-containing protein n=1 Tax=Panagrolaimus sp. JU765 TaxID=591449 RepID=A0AC34RHQ0_9BILA
MGGRRGWEDDVENHDFPEATHFVARVSFGTRMLIIFDAKDTDLLGDGDKKDILDQIWETEQVLTENQKKVVCQVLIFSQKTAKIEEFTMEKILEMISEPELSISLFCEMTNLPGKIQNSYFENFEQYEFLTDQIFEIYWVKKFLEDEIRSQFMNQLSKSSKKPKWSEYFDKEELMSNLGKITNAWNQKMQQSSDLLEGKDVSMYDLWSTFPMEEILKLKNYA